MTTTGNLNYNDRSVEALCRKAGIEADALYENMAFRDTCELTEMILFLESNLQYDRIEYQGELKTKEELIEIENELFRELDAGLGLTSGVE